MKPSIGRPFVITLFVLMSAATAVSLISARSMGRGLKESEDAFAATLQELQLQDQRAFQEFETVTAEWEVERFFGDNPREIRAIRALDRSAEFFSHYLDRSEDDGSAFLAQAQAQVNLARIHQTAFELGKSESAYRKAIQLMSSNKTRFSDPAIAVGLGISNNKLSWVLANAGKLAEARNAANEAVSQLTQIMNADPRDLFVRRELAFAYRNLSLITAALGQDGAPAARDSLELAQNILSDDVRELRSVADVRVVFSFCLNREFHIDACQILMAFQWQAGRFSQAEVVCRESILALERLPEQVDELSKWSDLGLPSLKYHRALQQARRNLETMRSDRASVSIRGPQEMTIATGWEWTPLNCLPGESLHPGVFASGKMHADFERQAGLLLSWMDHEWPINSVVRIIEAVHQNVPIIILVANDLVKLAAQKILQEAGITMSQIRFLHVATDSLWIRDYGPLVVEGAQGQFKIVDAVFRPQKKPRSDYAPQALSDLLGLSIIPAPCVLEGGGLLCNGAGLCLVSNSLLTLNRERGLDQSHVTATIKRVTGATQVVYLEPLHDEPTGHLDWFATFTASDTLVLGDYRGIDATNADLLDRHAKLLQGLKTANGRLKVVRIPMPPHAEDHFGGTYTNVVYANGVLLVPTWPEASKEVERRALDVFRRLLPEWTIKKFDSHELGVMEGGPRCATLSLFRLKASARTPKNEDSQVEF